MKTLRKGAFCALLSLLYMGATAQKTVHEKLIPVNEPDYRKPKLFSDLPETISFNIDLLQSLLDTEIGKSVSIPITKTVNYQGIVISKSDAFDASSKSVVIKATNRKGATFTFSKVMTADGAFTYRGRIISFNNIDAFELALDNGQYMLQKKNLYELYGE